MKKWICRTEKEFSSATKKAKRGDVIIFLERPIEGSIYPGEASIMWILKNLEMVVKK